MSHLVVLRESDIKNNNDNIISTNDYTIIHT